MDTYASEHGDAPELIAEMMKNERFVLPEGASFYSLYERRHEPGNGERIDKALHAIEDANIAKLRDVFQDISFNSNKLGEEKQKNDLLRHLLEDFAKPSLNMRPSRIGGLDIIGNAYEYLIKHFASDAGRKAGEFYTPPEVSALMAEIMDMTEGEEACDPACGSGSLLMKCGRRVQTKFGGSKKYALYGQESIGSTWALAKMNMFLHGEDNHRLEWGDTIRNPKLLDGDDRLKHFDVVVANPPFTDQDRLLISLLSKDRLLEFIRYFILFDRKVEKIVARYQQAFGIKALLARISGIGTDGARQGGVIWHTTGSGKSFTMVYLCKALLLDDALKNCRIVVVTDRRDLEKQLAANFMTGGAFGSEIGTKKDGAGAKASSGRDLAKRIGKGSERIIFTIINKFASASKLSECHNDSADLIVLVDEGHRSQGGENHERMRTALLEDTKHSAEAPATGV